MRKLLGVATAFVVACSSAADNPSPVSPVAQHFGFAAVDCGHRDLLDAAATTNYLSEVAAFSSVAQLCVFTPDDLVRARLAEMDKLKVAAILSIQPLLYEATTDTSTGSGRRLRLRADHVARWKHFVARNALGSDAAAIAAFYLVDEPSWNGMTPADLRIGADLVKAHFPKVPVAMVEAAPALSLLQIPLSVDWVGFDHYAVARPDSDAIYLKELALLKSRRTRPSQKILLVMESQWLPAYGAAGYSEADMKSVAGSYARLAEKERVDVVGMLGYPWPGGLDSPAQKGARDLPESVRQEYVRIGKRMTGK